MPDFFFFWWAKANWQDMRLRSRQYLGTVRRLHLGFSGNVIDIGRRGRQSLLLRVREGATLADLKEREEIVQAIDQNASTHIKLSVRVKSNTIQLEKRKMLQLESTIHGRRHGARLKIGA
jgi:hypothetical protein